MRKIFQRNKQQGFTLVELLIVIAIIAILAVVVFVALDPLKRFQDARNSTRWSDVTAILDAIKLNQVDSGGSFIASITAIATTENYDKNFIVGADTSCTATTTVTDNCGAVAVETLRCVNLKELVDEGHLAVVPKDPSIGTAADSDYYISVASTGGVTVGACDPEGATPPVIKVTR